jgi:hypothetical protein
MHPPEQATLRAADRILIEYARGVGYSTCSVVLVPLGRQPMCPYHTTAHLLENISYKAAFGRQKRGGVIA